MLDPIVKQNAVKELEQGVHTADVAKKYKVPYSRAYTWKRALIRKLPLKAKTKEEPVGNKDAAEMLEGIALKLIRLSCELRL